MNTGLCDHATVTDKYTVTQLEALAEFVHLGGKGGGVASVPGEGIHGDGATSMVAEQAVDDLGSVGAVVAGVAPSGEFAAGACEVAGRDIVEGDGTLFKVALGELAFNGRLPLDKPVHGVVVLVDRSIVDVEQGSKGGLAGRAKLAFNAQSGTGFEQS